MPHFPRAARVSVGLLAATAGAILAAIPAAAEPTHVILTVPPGTAVPANLPATIAAWRQSGEIADEVWLDSSQRDAGAFATFVALDFPSEADYARWAKKDAPALDKSIEVRHAAGLADGQTFPRDSNHSVFRVDTFEATRGNLRDYAAQYITPLMEAQRQAKGVVRYTMYQQQDGKTAWLLTEYRDPAAAANATQVADGIRARLVASDAAFAALDRNGGTLRTAGTVTAARYSELPPPSLPDLPSYKPEVKLKGTLRVYGASLKNAVDYLLAGFQQFHPDLQVASNLSTSSEGALAGLYTGIADVAALGDDAKMTDEMPFFNVNGYMPTEISVATGGYERRGSLWAWVIVVNKDNPLSQISVDELKDVFGAERSGGWKPESNDLRFTAEYAKDKSTNIRTWDQLGLKGPGYKGREIQTYGFSAPGFQAAFERHWFYWSHKWNPNLMEYVERKQAVAGPNGDAVVSERPLEILSKDKYGMGIAGLMHVKDFPNLKILALSEHKGGPYIPFTPENVANRTYPLKRDAYFYVNKAPGRPLDPMVREFMRFVLSREGQEIMARVGYYYPLNAPYLAEQRKKLDQ